MRTSSHGPTRYIFEVGHGHKNVVVVIDDTEVVACAATDAVEFPAADDTDLPSVAASLVDVEYPPTAAAVESSLAEPVAVVVKVRAAAVSDFFLCLLSLDFVL